MIKCPICFHVNKESRAAYCENCGWKFKKPVLYGYRAATAVFILACIVGVAAWWVASGGLYGNQRWGTADALNALIKIAITKITVTEDNATYPEYIRVLNEAQTKVDEASSMLPEGELKKELNAAMDSFAKAGEVWTDHINEGVLTSQSEVEKKSSAALTRVLIAVLTVTAEKHLNRAASLYKESQNVSTDKRKKQ